MTGCLANQPEHTHPQMPSRSSPGRSAARTPSALPSTCGLSADGSEQTVLQEGSLSPSTPDVKTRCECSLCHLMEKEHFLWPLRTSRQEGPLAPLGPWEARSYPLATCTSVSHGYLNISMSQTLLLVSYPHAQPFLCDPRFG